MSEIIEDFYNNKQFQKKREMLESEGKTKEQIFKILKENLINMDTYQQDIKTLLKKQIMVLLEEKYGSDISEPILEVFKEKYEENISDLNKNISIVRAVCLEEGVLFDELISSTLTNMQDKIGECVNFHIKNCFQGNSKKIEGLCEITRTSCSDIIKILERLHKLEDRININLKSNVQLINRISDDNSSKNIKKYFNDEFENHYDLICKGKINHISSIQTLLESKYKSLQCKYNSLQSKLNVSNINETYFDKLIKRIEELENNQSNFLKEKESIYDMIIHNTNQTITNILNNEKQKQLNKNTEFEKKINNINKKIDELQKNHNKTKQGINEKLKHLDSMIKQINEKINSLIENNEKINSLIENIQITLKSISKKDVEKDINIKNEIEKIIEEKFQQSKQDTHSSHDDIINLKEDLYKIRGDINVLFHNYLTSNIHPVVNVQYPQYQ